MYGNILVPSIPAGVAHAMDRLLDCHVIDKVVEAESVRILKFKLVVIDQQTKEDKWIEDFG